MAYIAGTHPLDVEDRFPEIRLRSLTQQELRLPQWFGDQWGILLIYRGSWCGYCRRQLADFQSHLAALENLHATVVAASVDSLADAGELAAKLQLTYSVCYGLEPLGIATSLGCFYEAGDRFLQKCAFLLRPGGEIARSVYSSGPVGALTAADCLYSLEFFQKNPQHRVGRLRPVSSP
jgi:peroxiredoxin